MIEEPLALLIRRIFIVQQQLKSMPSGVCKRVLWLML